MAVLAGPTGEGAGSKNTTPAIPTKELLVAALLLLFLLMLATHYPKYVTGFMMLMLVGVVLTHADIVKNFFAI